MLLPRAWRGAVATRCGMNALACTLMALLVACGGGDSLTAGGVGSGGTGLAEGTVTGLGSVIVDGQTYVETDAAVVTEDAAGSAGNTAVKLGQRVRVSYSTSGTADVASRIEVVPQLFGPVTAVADALGVFQVMGQTVALLDGASSRQAVLAGISQLNGLAVGDWVEVHGSWTRTTSGRYRLVASRVEKRDAASTVGSAVLLSGVVHARTAQTTGARWRLNADNGLLLSAASVPAAMVNGSLVRVWLPASALGQVPAVADRVALADLTALAPAGTPLRFGAQAADYNRSTRTLQVQGVSLQLPTDVQLDETALSNGGYVTVQLSRSGEQWQVLSGTVQAGGTSLQRDIELRGVVSGVDFSTDPVSWSMRGIAVQASRSVIDDRCLSAGSTDVYMQVTGRLTGREAVVASQVQCPLQQAPTGATVERRGQVLSVDTTTRTLVLQTLHPGQGVRISAQWDANSYFPISPDTLPGLTVEIEGIQNGSQLRIRRVRM
jgi:hypothetical protein